MNLVFDSKWKEWLGLKRNCLKVREFILFWDVENLFLVGVIVRVLVFFLFLLLKEDVVNIRFIVIEFVVGEISRSEYFERNFF